MINTIPRHMNLYFGTCITNPNNVNDRHTDMTPKYIIIFLLTIFLLSAFIRIKKTPGRETIMMDGAHPENTIRMFFVFINMLFLIIKIPGKQTNETNLAWTVNR